MSTQPSYIFHSDSVYKLYYTRSTHPLFEFNSRLFNRITNKIYANVQQHHRQPAVDQPFTITTLGGSLCQWCSALSFQTQPWVHFDLCWAFLEAFDEGGYFCALWPSMLFGSRNFHTDLAQLARVCHTLEEHSLQLPFPKSLSTSLQRDSRLFAMRVVCKDFEAQSISLQRRLGYIAWRCAGQHSSWKITKFLYT